MRRLAQITHLAMSAIFLLAFAFNANAQTTLSLTEARQIFAAGNASYRAQHYSDAAKAYEQLVGSGYDTAAVLYNLGTTNARLGSNTLALAHLQRAKNLEPRNDDMRANLAYVKAEKTEVGPATEAGSASAESLWSKIYGWLTAEEWLMVVWWALLVCCVGVAIILLVRSRRMVGLGRALMTVGGTVFVLTAIPATAQVYATKIVKKAIAIEFTEMLSGPAPRFTRVSSLDEGESVRLLGHESGGYERVETADGIVGYVRQSELVKI